MLDRNWMRSAAVGVTVTVAVFAVWLVFSLLTRPACFPNGQWIANNAAQQQVDANSENDGAYSLLQRISSEDQQRAGKQRYPSAEPHEVADLIQQARSADAAERLVALTRCQVGASAAEGALLLVTVLLGIAALMDARESSLRQLRAYLFVERAELSEAGDDAPLLNVTNLPKFRLIVRNSGQTPALRMVHWAVADIGRNEDEARFTVPKTLAPLSLATVPAGGHVTKDAFLPRQMTAEEVSAVQRGSLSIYIYGVVEYHDIFKMKRRSTYRLRHTGSWPPATNAVAFFCDVGNEAD